MKVLYDEAKREHRWKLKRTNGQAIGLILLIVLAFFVTKWVLQGAFFKNDAVLITIPLEDLYSQIQRSGQSPFWAPELAGGYPLLAIGQLGYWYPLHMLLRQFLPGVWTLNLSMMLHAMLAAVGTFLFLKHNKINKVAAGSAALLLPLGVTFVGKYEMFNLVFPFMWVSLMFLFLQLFIERGKLNCLLFWVGANVLCVLVGHPQMTVYVLFSEAIFTLCLTCLQWRRWPRALMILFGVFLTVGLTSFYLLPIIDNISVTDRATGFIDKIFEYEFSPAVLRGIVLVHPFGHDRAYSGPPSESELSSYIGPLALGLAILGLFTGRRKFPVIWWLSLSLVIIGLSLAMGKYSPIFRWIVNHGWWKYFNFPSRFFAFTHIGLALLMAIGLDFFISYLGSKRPNINKIIIYFLLVGTLAPALLVSWFWDTNVPWKFTSEPAMAKLLQQENGLVRVVSFEQEKTLNIAPDNDFGFMVWNPICLKCVYRQSFVSPFDVMNGIAVKLSGHGLEDGILTLSLYAGSGEKIRESNLDPRNIKDDDWNSFSFKSIENIKDKEFYFEITSNMRKEQAPRLFIHTNPVEQYDPSGRLYTCVNKNCVEVDAGPKSTDTAFKVLTNSTKALSGHEALAPYVSVGYGINSALWKGSLPILDVNNYFKPIEKGISIRNDTYALINRFPITHIIGLYPSNRYGTNLKGFSLLSSVSFGDQFLRLYRNNQALPRLQFVQNVKAVSSSDGQISALSQLDPQDQKTVVADINRDVIFDVSGNKAQIIKDGRTQVIIQTEQDTEGFIVLRDVLLKGWEATIDGRSVNINRVDGIFRGVLVPAGKHTVIFNYSPKWVRPAIYIEIISVGIFIMLIVLACRQSQNSKQKKNVL
jgi:hypothetical protein